jgi:hypothetical protein
MLEIFIKSLYVYNKDQQDALFTFNFIPTNNFYMFRAGLLLTIRRYESYIQQLVYGMCLWFIIIIIIL